MDTGIWATWYNLADDTRDAYLEWAHGTYLPFLKQLPGYAWVAHYRHEGGGPKMKRVEETVVGHTDEDIGAGYQYVMLVGAPSAHTFFHPALSEIELPDSFRERLALRQGVRTAIFTEEARVSGPAAAQASPGSTPGPYIQMGKLPHALAGVGVRPRPLVCTIPAAVHGADAGLSAHAQADLCRGVGEACGALRVRIGRDAAQALRRAARVAFTRQNALELSDHREHRAHAGLADDWAQDISLVGPPPFGERGLRSKEGSPRTKHSSVVNTPVREYEAQEGG